MTGHFRLTHFYSSGKNTDEMIKLLEVLLGQYRDCTRLYFSWDAAGWHASRRFLKRVGEVNSRKYRRGHGTPNVEIVPLPARAQFLNVIESIFNGLAVSVVHNSDYASVDEAKAAIDRYFAERNLHFQQNPKRAGNKMCGNGKCGQHLPRGSKLQESAVPMNSAEASDSTCPVNALIVQVDYFRVRRRAETIAKWPTGQVESPRRAACAEPPQIAPQWCIETGFAPPCLLSPPLIDSTSKIQ